MNRDAATVLVVDDDEYIRELIRSGLEGDGYRVVTAPNGQAALDVLDATTVNLILLDMRMPIMDGWTFARNYHRQPSPRAPVVVVSAAADGSQRAADIGAALIRVSHSSCTNCSRLSSTTCACWTSPKRIRVSGGSEPACRLVSISPLGSTRAGGLQR